MRLFGLHIFMFFLMISTIYGCKTDSDCGTDIRHKLCDSENECVSCLYDSNCSSEDKCTSNGYCELKSISDAFDYKIGLAIFSIFFGSSLASAGGLGGGGIFVPIFVLIIGLTAKSASALSQATIFSGQCANICLQLYQNHVSPTNRVLPDLTTILVLEPMLLGGTVIGVLLNQILPDYVILLFLTVTLIIITIYTCRKGLDTWKKEVKRELKAIVIENKAVTDEDENIDGSIYTEAGKDLKTSTMLVLLVWIIVSIFSILRSSESIAGIKVCSSSYWLVTFLMHPFLFLITVTVIYLQFKSIKMREDTWKPSENDVNWGKNNIFLYPIFSIGIGIFGGLTGIGGGMLITPMLLGLKMKPSVAAATSSLAVLITSSSATLQFLLIHLIKLDYMFLFMSIGIIGTLIGKKIIGNYVKKHKRESIIIFSVALVIGLATLLMTLYGIINIVNKKTSGSFRSFC